MDVTQILLAEHRAIEALIEGIRTDDDDARAPLVDQLLHALHCHMEVEETVVYPVMKELTDAETLQEANTEHELARKAMADVVRLSPSEPGFDAALDVLEAGVAHHIGNEESKIFPVLQGSDSAMEAMREPFKEKRLALGLDTTK